MSKIFNNVSIAASSLTEAGTKLKVIGGVKLNENKEDTGIVESYEQSLIDDFKEQNSPKNNKINQIYGKFLAGKELSQGELEYLAKNSPEMYKEVCKIMLERKAMEQRMKRAETKQEVSMISVNAVANVKKTMGTGEQAKSQATATMARSNQFSNAYVKYTATPDYKHKEDAKTQAEDMRAKLEQIEAEMMERKKAAEEAELLAEVSMLEMAENTEISEESDTLEEAVGLENAAATKSEASEAKEIFDTIEEQERRRRKRKIRQHGSGGDDTPKIHDIKQLNIDYESLWKKTKELYRSSTGSSTTVQKSNGDVQSSETDEHLNVSL